MPFHMTLPSSYVLTRKPTRVWCFPSSDSSSSPTIFYLWGGCSWCMKICPAFVIHPHQEAVWTRELSHEEAITTVSPVTCTPIPLRPVPQSTSPFNTAAGWLPNGEYQLWVLLTKLLTILLVTWLTITTLLKSRSLSSWMLKKVGL